ncbi:MAG: hypothetical protein HOV94_19870 [Saccharothrix sp.]|nr:hypothetical protein [Saccharothrix sp.]
MKQHDEVWTGQQIEEQVAVQLEVEHGPFVAMLIEIAEGAERVDDVLDAQAAQLREQVPTRSAPGQPGAHYVGIPHRELYRMVTENVDAGVIGEIGDVWTEIGNRLAKFNDDVAAAIGDSETNWTGRAGDRARQELADLGNRAGETGVAAQLAGTLFTQQSRALSVATNSVPLPPDPPFDPELAQQRLMSITDPVQYAEQAAADQATYARQQADHEQAARVVAAYDRTLAQTAAAQPAYGPPPPPAPTEPVVPGRSSVASSPERDRQAVAPPPRVGDDMTDKSVAAPPTAGGGVTNTSGVGTFGGDGQSPSIQGGPNPLAGGSATPAHGGGAVLPGPIAGDKGRPGRVSGPGRGGFGGGGGRASGGAGNPNAARNLDAGKAAGVTAGREAPAARGGAGATGTAGRTGSGAGMPGGGGGVGAAKGQGDEDTERETPSYLINEDNGNEIVGELDLVMPPVIGE